jgi:hypothetical protein
MYARLVLLITVCEGVLLGQPPSLPYGVRSFCVCDVVCLSRVVLCCYSEEATRIRRLCAACAQDLFVSSLF